MGKLVRSVRVGMDKLPRWSLESLSILPSVFPQPPRSGVCIQWRERCCCYVWSLLVYTVNPRHGVHLEINPRWLGFIGYKHACNVFHPPTQWDANRVIAHSFETCLSSCRCTSGVVEAFRGGTAIQRLYSSQHKLQINVIYAVTFTVQAADTSHDSVICFTVPSSKR